MLKTTFIARSSDGLILCETYESSSNDQADRLKINARQLLKRSENFTGEVQCSVDIEDHKFHFITRQGIVYMTIAERQYNQKLVFVYLQEVADAFQEELRNAYGSANNIDYLSKVETIENQYAFLRFERVIIKKKKEFKDMNAQENLEKLNQELVDVNKIMTESFEMLLNRDNNLNKISAQSSTLRDVSKDLRKGAQNMKMAMWFRKYMTPIIIAAIVFFLIFVKIFVF